MWIQFDIESRALSRYPKTGSSTLTDKPPSADSSQSASRDELSETIDEGRPALPKIIKFTDLARCGDEVWIEHERQIYRLRRTRQGKLILTK